MAARTDQRKVSMVRTYLASLRDDPEGRSKDSLQAVARENAIPVRSLRQFRDGKDNAIPAMVLTAWSKMLGTDGDIAGVGDISPISREWYDRTILQRDHTRLGRFDQFELIDQTRPEAASALDAWADIVVTGGVGDEGRRRSAFDPELADGGARLQDLLWQLGKKINRVLLPEDEKLKIVRDMAKYGEQFEQIGLTVDGERRTISRLVNMPVKTMWIRRDKDGWIDPAAMYYQLLPHQSEPTATWPAWKIVHFANMKSRANTHGTSIFDSCLRAYIQIEAMEAGMIIRRLERAPLRMKHVLDVGHLSSEAEISKAKAQYRTATKKVRTIDGNRNFAMQRINMPPDEDYLVAKRDKDSPADVAPVEGDGNIGQIADYLHFFNKWLSGLGPPKAHLGYEGDTMRSVVTDLHIVFARKGRRMQMQFIRGLTHLYWIELILMGIDPRAVPFSIVPPSLGTRDELIRAQVQVAHATTVQALAKSFAQTGRVPSIQWFLRYVMNLDDATLKGLELDAVIDPLKRDAQAPPSPRESVEMADAAMTVPEVVAEVNKAGILLGERAVADGKGRLVGLDVPLVTNPWGAYFEDVVRLLGVKELRTTFTD